MSNENRQGGDEHGSTPAVGRRAAQYVRMSTEHQQYSTENQADAISQYAALHGFEIVRTYADEGKSGLRRGSSANSKFSQDIRPFPISRITA